MQRWNLLQFKFEKVRTSDRMEQLVRVLEPKAKRLNQPPARFQARTYMGLGNYNASLAFLASSRHELRSIMSLLSSATEFIDSRLSCSAVRGLHHRL